MKLAASWIWLPEKNKNPYNLAAIAKKSFNCSAVKEAWLAVTADSWYRVYINGKWINDGPCRAWPEHYQYELLDVTDALKEGENTIEILARYWGAGTFHQVPQGPGILAQLEITPNKGKPIVVKTGRDWEIAKAECFVSNTPKTSIQMEPAELYDARKESLKYQKAFVVCKAEEGPWKDLNPRDVPTLTRIPRDFKKYCGVKIVDADFMDFQFNVFRLLHPGVVAVTQNSSTASAAATVIRTKKPMTLEIAFDDFNPLEAIVNGSSGENGKFELKKGDNLFIVLFYKASQSWEQGLRFVTTQGFELVNPLKPGFENPWVFVPLGEKYFENDMIFPWAPNTDRASNREIAEKDYELVRKTADLKSFKKNFGKRAMVLKAEEMLAEHPYRHFRYRRPIGDAAGCVCNPEGLMHDNSEWTIVTPSKEGDIELLYDLGEESVGYLELELAASAGDIVDIFAVEYITGDGEIQFTGDNSNGVRYICKEGRNHFISTKRRAGRYFFVTLRNLKKPVKIRLIRLIESTYPVDWLGSFRCSDANLNRIWDISARTLELCMEDTFTDCPLYEQTLWVGDARNESLYAMTAVRAYDLVKRCITLAAQSLERYPIVGCQVPSSWDCLLPAWSFLWGISVWEYYYHTGDVQFLEKIWDSVKKNLKGAEKLADGNGLFSGPFWNMFDWSGVDSNHHTMLHNSMFLVGAIDAARKCAEVLGDSETNEWLTEWRSKLAGTINGYWDNKKKAYPDSILENGETSQSSCVHTSFLSLLYDIAPEEHKEAILKNCLEPPDWMIKVGSPFAVQFLYEALEKYGKQDAILDNIYQNYLPMLRVGATTVWEQLPVGSWSWKGFPTRSHCHAWSSAPVYFLNRIILGITQLEAGGKKFRISPRVNRAEWAQGATATPFGTVKVRWSKNGKDLKIEAEAPAGVELIYETNETLEGFNVEFQEAKIF